MIEIDDFVSESLKAIVRGIIQGQSDPELGTYIAPLIQGEKRNDHGNFHLKGDDTNQATIVEFDLNVVADFKSEGGGGAKGKFRFFVVDVDLGGEGKATSQTSSAQRLKFAIPLKIPKCNATPS